MSNNIEDVIKGMSASQQAAVYALMDSILEEMAAKWVTLNKDQ